MPIKVVTAPAALPVTIAEAKAFSRISIDDDDTLLTALITTATAHAEHFTGLRFVTQTLDLYLDSFPGMYGTINVPGPVASITSIKYIDMDGDEQTMDSADYITDLISNPARITPAYEGEWPETREQVNAVVVRFVQGGETSACPEEAKTFIKAYVGHVYDGLTGDPLKMYSGLLDPIRREFAV